MLSLDLQAESCSRCKEARPHRRKGLGDIRHVYTRNALEHCATWACR